MSADDSHDFYEVDNAADVFARTNGHEGMPRHDAGHTTAVLAVGPARQRPVCEEPQSDPVIAGPMGCSW